jgi:hypothetical protein
MTILLSREGIQEHTFQYEPILHKDSTHAYMAEWELMIEEIPVLPVTISYVGSKY